MITTELAFLSAWDLDDTAAAAAAVDAQQAQPLFREVIGSWTDVQAVANLLLHPALLPSDVRVPALINALVADAGYLCLAAAVGCRTLSDRHVINSPNRVGRVRSNELVDALLPIIEVRHGMIARRAAIGLHGLVTTDRLQQVLEVFDHPDPEVRRAAAAALVRLCGGAGVLAVLADPEVVAPPRATAVLDTLAADGIELMGSSVGLAPALDPLPNLRDFLPSAPSPRRDGGHDVAGVHRPGSTAVTRAT